MSGVNPLLVPAAPWVFLGDLDDERVWSQIRDAGEIGMVGELNGADLRKCDELMDRISQIFEFPDYFGGNWDALDECLADLSWLPADSYLLVVRRAEKLLSEEPVWRSTFLNVMSGVAVEWATPVHLGEWWDRPAKPFHTVLDPGALEWPDKMRSMVGHLSEG